MKKHIIFVLIALFTLTPGIVHPQDRDNIDASEIELVMVHGQAEREGGRAFLHMIVVIMPGEDREQVIRESLAAQGATPYDPHQDEASTARAESAQYNLLSLVWSQFSDTDPNNDTVFQYYNPTGELRAATEQALINSQATWSNEPGSNFHFTYGGQTTRCPSLFPQCGGVYDGFNDVMWLSHRNEFASPRHGSATMVTTKRTWESTSACFLPLPVFLT